MKPTRSYPGGIVCISVSTFVRRQCHQSLATSFETKLQTSFNAIKV